MDITALSGWIELAWYYVPYLDERARKGAGDNKAPGYCSAFIATGSYTEDKKIVVGHNNWVDYIIGAHWNVIADIVPAAGQRILMDCLPEAIHSGDDFVTNGTGQVYMETTCPINLAKRPANTTSIRASPTFPSKLKIAM